MKVQANQLESHLRQFLLPCYLVTGDEPLIVLESLDAIRRAARERGFGARELHVAASAGFDWKATTASAGNLSLFAERRIIDLRLPTGKPGRQGAAAILELVDRSGDDLLLLISAPKLDRSGAQSKWAKAVESAGALINVWPVGRRELPNWIRARMRNAGLEPDRDAVRLVADRVEGNLLAAAQEIEKLRLLMGEGPVSAGDVDAAVADSSRFDVYKLVDAAISGNAERAIRILGSVRGDGTEAVIVVWALTRELRLLAQLSYGVANGAELGEAMRKARVWRSRESLLRSALGRHDADHYFALMHLARRADAAAKGQIAADPWQLATEIVLGLALGNARAA